MLQLAGRLEGHPVSKNTMVNQFRKVHFWRTQPNAVITIAIRLRYDYDPTTKYRARLLPIRRKQKMNM